MEQQLPIQGGQQPSIFTQRDEHMILFMEDLTAFFDEKYHSLIGERGEFNPTTAQMDYKKSDSPPTMNETGASWFIDQLKSIANVNTVMTNISDMDAALLAKEFAHTINDELYINRERYGIDIHNFRSLHFSALMFAYLALRRGIGGIERRDLIGSQKSVQTVYTENVQGGGGGLFGFFKPK
jgi:hypothetical protein